METESYKNIIIVQLVLVFQIKPTVFDILVLPDDSEHHGDAAKPVSGIKKREKHFSSLQFSEKNDKGKRGVVLIEMPRA